MNRSTQVSSKDNSGTAIGLQIGYGGHLRQWPVEYFADLAYRLVQDLGARVVLFGSKAERDLGKQLHDEWCSLAGKGPGPEEVWENNYPAVSLSSDKMSRADRW